MRERTEREVDGVDEPGECRARWCWWWRRWWGVTDVRAMVQAWYFPAHFVILTSNWGTTYVGVILMQTGLRDQLVIHLWWERTRYGFGQTTGRRESETQESTVHFIHLMRKRRQDPMKYTLTYFYPWLFRAVLHIYALAIVMFTKFVIQKIPWCITSFRNCSALYFKAM